MRVILYLWIINAGICIIVVQVTVVNVPLVAYIGLRVNSATVSLTRFSVLAEDNVLLTETSS